MKKLVLLPLMALFVVAGCQDLNPNQAAEAKADIAAPSFSAGSDAASAPADRTTVCVAYDSELARAEAEGDAEKAATLQTIIADACN